VLGHTSASPDYSDYVEVQKEAKGYFDTNIVDLEGPDFDELGVLDAIVQQVVYLFFFSEQSTCNHQNVARVCLRRLTFYVWHS
jgi:hypothetical protein